MQIEELNDLANNPILRFGANAMTAFDGFTRAMVASSEARIRAYDRLAQTSKKVSAKELKAATEAEFAKMFDETGMITDKAVDYSSREIALSLDNAGVDALNDLIKRAPIMKPFLMFPRTQMNAIALFDSQVLILSLLRISTTLLMPTSTRWGRQEWKNPYPTWH